MFFIWKEIHAYMFHTYARKMSNSTKEGRMKIKVPFQPGSSDTSMGLKYSFRIFYAHMGTYFLSNASLLQTIFRSLLLLLNDKPRTFPDEYV